MKIDDYGQVTISEDEAFDALYSNKISTLDNVHLNSMSVIEQYNHARNLNADRIPELLPVKDLSISREAFDAENQKNWFMPPEYKDLNIIEFLLDKCQNEEQYQRVIKELDLFVQYDMVELLIYCKYLVDTIQENNIVCGVGRGSSVASYVLYLIGVHKIDSLKYDLDINEFLK